MPKIAEYPRFRTHTRKGAKNGQVWTSYWWDGRAFGQDDVPLGTDREAAVAKWRECEAEMAALVREDARALAGMMLRAVDALPLPGVYFMMNDAGAVIYVGQSQDVTRRLTAHLVKEYASVRMVPVKSDVERAALEKAFIRFLSPPLNKALGVAA